MKRPAAAGAVLFASLLSSGAAAAASGEPGIAPADPADRTGAVAAPPAPAERAGGVALAVEITGADFLSREELKDVVIDAAGPCSGSADAERILDSVLDLYRFEGFGAAAAEVRITAIDSSLVRCGVVVNEGGRFVLSTLRIRGGSRFGPERLERIFGMRPGDPLTVEAVEEGVERILDLYEGSGHLFVRVRLKPEWPAGGGAGELQLLVEEGPRAIIELVSLPGDAASPELAAKLSGLWPGSTANPRRLSDAAARLGRTGYFKRIGEPVLKRGTAMDRVVVEIPAERLPGNTIEGLAGYASGDGDEESAWTGYLRLSFMDIFGTGRDASVYLAQPSPVLRRFNARVRDNWFFGLPPALEVAFEQEVEDTLFVSVSGSASLYFPLPAAGIEVSAGYDIERVYSAGGSGSGEEPARRDRLVCGFYFDATDDAFNPSRGMRGSASGAWGLSRFLETGVHTEEAEGESKLSVYFNPAGRHVLALEAHASGRFGGGRPLPRYRLIEVGGYKTIRGYHEAEWLVRRALFGRFEYRFLTGPGSRLFIFIDSGFLIWDKSGDEGVEELSTFVYGSGFGIRMESRLGVLGLDYGVAPGDGLAGGKVHLGIENRF